MQFVLCQNAEPAIATITERLKQELAGDKKVLWLISGGSQFAANKQIMAQIPDDMTANLTVMLMDERYGPVGHNDSNWAQQMTVGFDGRQANLQPILVDDLDFEQTAKRYAEIARQAFADNDIVFGQFGMGADGHTAGILPESVAAASQEDWVAHYEALPLRRMTLTFNALSQINVGYLLAFGENKQTALKNLQNNLPLPKQPAQIIKQLSESYIYNDQVEDA